ncbi:hypothetical protein OSSY52_17990 [Tepiditoga spiralis]|uniref:4Fe-4S domain-containing protein n=1 Tax=Tepiditoga spiralis TaxID=2108365 RepID=A0A7G1G525_9BACT|nr:(Fe-S)-binding protein [Tepiditoga spiralis]BBE31658.1 hypothetical protein OSSY52_17990 [Tepiditoga spiralis]
MSTIINAVLLLGILGFASGAFLAFAAKKFEVKEDVRKILAEAVLPGANCGACGFPGCSGFASGFVKGTATADGCLPGKRTGVPEKLKKINAMSDEELEKLFEENNNDIDAIKKAL